MSFPLKLVDLDAPPPPKLLPPPPDPALLDAARVEGDAEGHARGVRDGIAEGKAQQAASQDAAMQRALTAIATSLQDAAEAGRQAAEEAALGLASLLFQTLDLALPGAAARLGPKIVPQLLVPLLPAIADRPEAVLRVAPGLVEAIAARMPQGAPAVVADETVPPGDALLSWRDGAWLISLERRRAAIAAALLMLGLEETDR